MNREKVNTILIVCHSLFGLFCIPLFLSGLCDMCLLQHKIRLIRVICVPMYFISPAVYDFLILIHILDNQISIRMDVNTIKDEGRYLWSTVILTLLITAVMWISWGADMLLHLDLPRFGIIPRTIVGLRGILFSPYIHDNRNVMHILSNTPPFAVLFFLLLNVFRRIAIPVYILIQLLSGLLLWLFGPGETVTVGMSGVIFGLAGFLVGSGFFRRNLVSLVLAFAVIFFYGGSLAASILPQQPGVSWQAHICGLIAGLFVAFNVRNYDRAPSTSLPRSDDGHFFDRHP